MILLDIRLPVLGRLGVVAGGGMFSASSELVLRVEVSWLVAVPLVAAAYTVGLRSMLMLAMLLPAVSS